MTGTHDCKRALGVQQYTIKRYINASLINSFIHSFIHSDKVVICSDSSAVLKSVQSFKSQSRQDIVYELLECYTMISLLGVKVKCTWMPAHIGVKEIKW